jgi:hypothetical protein
MVKNWGAAAAFLALLGLVGVATWLDLPAPYHRCHGANDCGQTSKDNHKATEYVTGTLALGQFVDTHNGAVSAIATIMIAAFTVVLAIRTGGLFKETAALRAIAEQQQADLLRSINATENLAEAAHDSAEVARAEFNATHRPHLVIRDVAKDGDNILYLVVNIGDAPATIVESWITSQVVDARTTIRPLRSLGHDDLGRLHFSVGEIKDLTYVIPEHIGVSFSMKNVGGRDAMPAWLPERVGTEYHFFGTIVYRDASGQFRRTVFRRCWNFQTQSFLRYSDEDQEYSD